MIGSSGVRALSVWMVWAALVVGLMTSTAVAGVGVQDLKCEYRTNPLGIDVGSPRLSWCLTSSDRGQRQTAYQVWVATRAELLAADQGDLWDSGHVKSQESIGIVYAGRPIQSGQRVWWKVRVWDKDGKPSSSETAWWEMALLNRGDWQAQWIRQDKPLPGRDEDFYGEDPAPLLRKAFSLSKGVKRARVYASGLGYYELYLNGQRVGDQVLDPGWTTYGKRVLYSTFDVTELLQRGDNVVGAMLGNGWYNPLPLRMWGRFNLREYLTVGRPRLILQLNIEYEDGSRQSVITDQTWRVAEGPVRKNSVYLGELYDARREPSGWKRAGFDDSQWSRAVVAGEPLGRLVAQSAAPIRVTATVKPVRITQPKPGVYVFDMGQNFAGWVRLKARGPAGTQITLTHGELLFSDGMVNARTTAAGQVKREGARGGPGAPENAFQRDCYILCGKGEEVFVPHFTFHGFRYVEVVGYPGPPSLDALEGLRLNAAVEPAGEFACSNEMFNRIQRMFGWTLLSNLFSVQSDCPHREKFGYGGDIVSSDEAAIMNFDMATLYAKIVNDFHDAVRPNGALTETSPFVGIDVPGLGDGAGPVGWGTAHPLLQRHLVQYYADQRLVQQQYETTERWVAVLQANAVGHILNNGIGDHESLVEKSIPVSGTAFYYLNVRLASELAAILGRRDDADRYASLAQQIRAAFNARFLDRQAGRYDTGTQANQAFALALGLVPSEDRSRVLGTLVRDIVQEHHGHLTTGIFGTNYMLQSLSRFGRADVAYTVVNQKTFPGWGHMLAGGATTLWEHWEFSDNTFSHNHPMFGSVSAWFYQWLAGIQPADDARGFDKIVICPQRIGDLSWAKARYRSIRGPVESSWRIEDGQFLLDVSVPVNATAVVFIPAGKAAEVREGDRPAGQAPGIRSVDERNGVAVLGVESGSYRFRSPVQGN